MIWNPFGRTLFLAAAFASAGAAQPVICHIYNLAPLPMAMYDITERKPDTRHSILFESVGSGPEKRTGIMVQSNRAGIVLKPGETAILKIHPEPGCTAVNFGFTSAVKGSPLSHKQKVRLDVTRPGSLWAIRLGAHRGPFIGEAISGTWRWSEMRIHESPWFCQTQHPSAAAQPF